MRWLVLASNTIQRIEAAPYSHTDLMIWMHAATGLSYKFCMSAAPLVATVHYINSLRNLIYGNNIDMPVTDPTLSSNGFTHSAHCCYAASKLDCFETVVLIQMHM